MKTIFSSIAKFLIVIGMLALTQSCSESSDNVMENGETEFKITDAPLDDASITGVYITIRDIKVGGVSVAGFTKQTINLKDYEDGTTRSLATTLLAAKTHNDLELVLDTETDAEGHSPGCYIKSTTSENKFSLNNGTATSITVNNDWTVRANRKSPVVMDVDLRKAIVIVDDPSIRYTFANQQTLQESVRVLNENKAGTIHGFFYASTEVESKNIIAYAYKRASFNPRVETQPQGADGILFVNAVTSAKVEDGPISKVFTLDFLEAGDYELYFASYVVDANNQPVFKEVLFSEVTSGDTSYNVVSVPAGWTASVIVQCKAR